MKSSSSKSRPAAIATTTTATSLLATETETTTINNLHPSKPTLLPPSTTHLLRSRATHYPSALNEIN